MDRAATDEELLEAAEVSRKAGDPWLHERVKETMGDGGDEDEEIDPEQQAKAFKKMSIIEKESKKLNDLADKLAKDKNARNELN